MRGRGRVEKERKIHDHLSREAFRPRQAQTTSGRATIAPPPPLEIFTFALQIRNGGKRGRGFCARRFARRDAINERRSVRGRRAPAVYTRCPLARTLPLAAHYNPLTINEVLMKWNVRRCVRASTIDPTIVSVLPSLAATTERAPHDGIIVTRFPIELDRPRARVRSSVTRLPSISARCSRRLPGGARVYRVERNGGERTRRRTNNRISSAAAKRPSFTRVVLARGSSACALAAHLIKRD